jgi:hypothetical protein
MGDLLQSIAGLDAWAYWSIVLVLGGGVFVVFFVGYQIAISTPREG